MQNIKYFIIGTSAVTDTINLNGYSFSLISDSNPLQEYGVQATQKITSYAIEFDDNSTIEIHGVNSSPHYSKVDTTPGKHRLEFMNKFKPEDAIKILNRLKMSLGYTHSENMGDVVVVNPKCVTRKIWIH